MNLAMKWYQEDILWKKWEYKMKNDVYCQKFSIQIDPKFTIRLTEQKRSFENRKFVYNVILPKFSVEIKKMQ